MFVYLLNRLVQSCKEVRITQPAVVLVSKTATFNLFKSLRGIFWHMERQQFGILFKVDKKVVGPAPFNTASANFLPNLERFLAIDSFLSGLYLESRKELI